MPVTDTPLDVHTASQHLWEALSHHQITMDIGAHDPLVMAIASYGDSCRKQDQAAIDAASRHIWEEVGKHRSTLDLGAAGPVVSVASMDSIV